MPPVRLISVDAAAFADRAALGAAVSAADAEVAVVRHSPHLLRWRSAGAAIARAAGLVIVGGGRTGGANLILSSLSVDYVDVRDELFGANPLRPSGVTVARLRFRGAPFAVAAASLNHPSERARVDAAVARVADVPVLLSLDARWSSPSGLAVSGDAVTEVELAASER